MSEQRALVALATSPEGLPRRVFVNSSTKSWLRESYEATYAEHLDLLHRTNVDTDSARAMMLIKSAPAAGRSSGSADLNSLASERYDQISRELAQIKNLPSGEGVEQQAVETAEGLIGQMRSRQLAPPELGWIGTEAVMMLWALGNTQIAVTVTEGEFGYTIRRDKRTIERVSNLKPETFKMLRLSQQ